MDPGLRRDDVASWAAGHPNLNVIPTQVGIHANLGLLNGS
jgi:hypothetical protein